MVNALVWSHCVPSTAKSLSLEKRQMPELAGVDSLVWADAPSSLSRAATIRWLGHPPGGAPRLTVGSHSLIPAPTLNVDLALPDSTATSPGELLAGGFGIIFARAVAHQLVREETQASELVVQVAFVLSQDGPNLDPILRGIRCELEARVCGIDQAHLAQVGEQALRQSIGSLTMRADALSLSLAVSLVGDPMTDAAERPHSTSVGAIAVPSGSGALPASESAGELSAPLTTTKE
jgi:hypothetical protein